MSSDRTQIALSVALYAIADLCVYRINPANPWIAALQLGLIALFSSVCLYGVALLVHGSFSKRVVSVGSFAPAINRTIQIASSLICASLVVYSLFMLLPVYTDHHSLPAWRKLVNFQSKVIECVEGRAIAERFWNNCASHLTFAAVCFEREHDFERALDFYGECKKLGDESNYAHSPVDDVLGRVCDLMKDFTKADAHYSYLNPGVDENYKTDRLVSHAQLLRMFEYVPEEVILAEFPWAENVAAARNESAIELGEIYERIPFSKLDDFQRQLLRPAFHSEMLIKPQGEGYAPELESNAHLYKQGVVTPVSGRLLQQLRLSVTPVVTEGK